MFDAGAGDEEVAAGSADAQFIAQAGQGGLGETEEVAKFPGVKAIVLAADMRAKGNGSTDDGFEFEIGDGSGVVNFAGPEAKFPAGAGTDGGVPNPDKPAVLNHFVHVVDGKAGDAGDGFHAAEGAFDRADGRMEVAHVEAGAVEGRAHGAAETGRVRFSRHFRFWIDDLRRFV